MDTNHRNYKIIIFCIFIVGLLLRVTALERMPLADQEAELALEALHIAEGGKELVASEVSYTFFTGLFFFLFGTSNALARLFPALLGSLLVILPFCFGKGFSPVARLLLSFGLALDPGLIALSRTADGTILVIFFFIAAFIAVSNDKKFLAGICFALAVLSGHQAIFCLLILSIVYLPGYFFKPPNPEVDEDEVVAEVSIVSVIKDKRLLVPMIGTFLFVSMFGGLNPSGIGAWTSAITVFIKGWAVSGQQTPLQILGVLPAYHLIPLLGGIGYYVKKKDWTERSFKLGVWTIVGLLLVFIYQGFVIQQLVWVLLPLWIATALLITELEILEERRPIALIQAGVVFVLLILAYMVLISTRFLPDEGLFMSTRMSIILVIAGLLFLSTLMVELGWGNRNGLNGFVIGFLVALLILTSSWSIRITRAGILNTTEVWYPLPAVNNTRFLKKTISEFSLMNTGRSDGADIGVTIDSPSLNWALRDHNLRRVTAASITREQPPFVVTDGKTRIEAVYMGQDFAWFKIPIWGNIYPLVERDWIIFREAISDSEMIILWVRSDLFSLDSIIESYNDGS